MADRKRTHVYPNYIRYYCKQQGYTLQNLAEKIGLPRRTLTDYVTGVRPVPRTCLTKIARTLSCSIKDLVPSPGLEAIVEENANDVFTPQKQETLALQVSSKSKRQLKNLQVLQAISMQEIVTLSSPASPIILSQPLLPQVQLTPLEVPSHNHIGTWLALETCQIGQLYELGWSTETILSTLKTLLQSVEGMPKFTRRKLLELSGAAAMSGITLPTNEQISETERMLLCEAVGKSIGESWKLFHTTSIPQVLAIGQAQLALLQQVHPYVYPSIRPLYYSGVYELIGATLYLLGYYDQARKMFEASYLAGLEAGNRWLMAQSLNWQAILHYTIKKHDEAIQTIEAALRLTTVQEDESQIRLHAHLLSAWAENAALQHKYTQAQRNLDEAETFLDKISPNEEFDRARWYQIAGNCLLVSNRYDKAAHYYEASLALLPESWLIRRAMTLIPLAATYVHLDSYKCSIKVAMQTMPIIDSINTTLINQQFAQYIYGQLLPSFSKNLDVQSFVGVAQQELPFLRSVDLSNH